MSRVATIVFGQATATDNCDPSPKISFKDVETAGSCPQEKTIVRTWTATDACGNSSSCDQTITVVDETAPEITCPDDKTFSCEETIVFGQATATDNCDPSPKISFKDVETAGSCPQEKTIVRTWTATDACGNSSSCDQTITVEDTKAPVITSITGDTTDQFVGCALFPAPPEITFEDNCGEVELRAISATGLDGCIEWVSRKWFAIDECGNTTTVDQYLERWNDSEPPTLSNYPADITAECDEVPVPEDVRPQDNCLIVEFVYRADTIQNPDDCENEYTIERIWYARDSCNNDVTHTQTITVIDTKPPVITKPIIDGCITFDELFGSILVPLDAEDNCGDTDIRTTDPTYDFNCEDFEITAQWTAIDDCGNVATCDLVIPVCYNPVTCEEIEFPETIFCGTTVDVTANASGGYVETGGDYTYEWSVVKGDWTIAGADMQTAQVTTGSDPTATIKVVITDFFGCQDSCEIELECCEYECGTSFARGNDGKRCFLDDGFSRWGWTIKLAKEDGETTYDIWEGAAQCDISKGDKVGVLTVDIVGDQAIVKYDINDGLHDLTETHLYIGCEKYPTKKDEPTVAPGQYPYKHKLNHVTMDSYTIDISDLNCDSIYIIAHAVTCELKCGEDINRKEEPQPTKQIVTTGKTKESGSQKALLGKEKSNRLSLRQSVNELELQLSPNPTINYLNVNVKAPMAGNGKLAAITSQGEIIDMGAVQLKKGDNDLTLDVSQMRSGVYTLQVKVNYTFQNARFIKIK